LFHIGLVSVKLIPVKREYTETNGRLFNISLIILTLGHIENKTDGPLFNSLWFCWYM